MILPWIYGFHDFIKAPLTWTMAGLCLLIFSATSGETEEHPLLEARALRLTGNLYIQYLSKDLSGETLTPDYDQLTSLGATALRDSNFLKDLNDFPFLGDPQDLERWRFLVGDFLNQSKSRKTFRFGLRRDPSEVFKRPWPWITYQFVHVDIFHLFGNLVFLILFGTAVEMQWGSLMLILMFLGGGIAGALFSVWTEPSIYSPMVGASASISGVMAFYLAAESRKRIRFLYFFAPFEGYFGEIYISKWWILPLFIFPDMINWANESLSLFLWKSRGILISHIATSAHLGGALFGCLVGLILIRLLPAQTRGGPYFPSHSGAP